MALTEPEIWARLHAAGLKPGQPTAGALAFGDAPHDLELPSPPRPAAVLIGIRPGTPGRQGGVLLTKRADSMTNHAGQVCFPGGGLDVTDASPEDAALREAEEEVALPRAHVKLAGRLGDYATISGFSITPVVGILPQTYTAHPASSEVAAVFELPLPVLLDPAAPERHETVFQGVPRHYWVWPHHDQHIWGATAAMLVELARLLRA
jgi:8-oxo-dGTP pyrophosphatase MutT (NUDIX family)